MDTIELKSANDAPRAETTSMELAQDPAQAVRHRQGPEKSDSSNFRDEDVLARFGKKQQLRVKDFKFCKGDYKLTTSSKRRFKSLSSIGLISGIMISWAAVLL